MCACVGAYVGVMKSDPGNAWVCPSGRCMFNHYLHKDKDRQNSQPHRSREPIKKNILKNVSNTHRSERVVSAM